MFQAKRAVWPETLTRKCRCFKALKSLVQDSCQNSLDLPWPQPWNVLQRGRGFRKSLTCHFQDTPRSHCDKDIYIYNLWMGPNQVSQFLHHVGYNILWLPFWHPFFCMFIDHHCVGLILWKMIHLRFWNARCLNLQLPFLVPSRFQGAFSLGFYGGYDAVKKYMRDSQGTRRCWRCDELMNHFPFQTDMRYESFKATHVIEWSWMHFEYELHNRPFSVLKLTLNLSMSTFCTSHEVFTETADFTSKEGRWVLSLNEEFGKTAKGQREGSYSFWGSTMVKLSSWPWATQVSCYPLAQGFDPSSGCLSSGKHVLGRLVVPLGQQNWCNHRENHWGE